MADVFDEIDRNLAEQRVLEEKGDYFDLSEADQDRTNQLFEIATVLHQYADLKKRVARSQESLDRWVSNGRKPIKEKK